MTYKRGVIQLFIFCEVRALNKKPENSKRASIVLHDIYGFNEFIKNQCQKFIEAGYDLCCPNMINKPHFHMKNL